MTAKKSKMDERVRGKRGQRKRMGERGSVCMCASVCANVCVGCVSESDGMVP